LLLLLNANALLQNFVHAFGFIIILNIQQSVIFVKRPISAKIVLMRPSKPMAKSAHINAWHRDINFVMNRLV